MKRPGFTLVETSVAIVLVASCALALAYLVTLAVSEHTAERTWQTAVDQMRNVLERLATLPPERLIAGDFDKSAAEALIERSIPDGKIVFETKQMTSDSILLIVTVSWCNGENRPRREVAMFRLLPHLN